MQTAPDAQEFEPLDGRARLLFHLQALARLVLFWGPIGVVGGFTAVCFLGPLEGVLLALCGYFAMALLSLWWPSWAFSRWGYLLRDDALLISHGVIYRRITAIPTHRIQHVDTRQGPIEQLFGLARLQVFTASGAGADGVIPGLALEVAQDLRDQLVAFEGDDGV